jgi:hypothetical protein
MLKFIWYLILSIIVDIPSFYLYRFIIKDIYRNNRGSKLRKQLHKQINDYTVISKRVVLGGERPDRYAVKVKGENFQGTFEQYVEYKTYETVQPGDMLQLEVNYDDSVEPSGINDIFGDEDRSDKAALLFIIILNTPILVLFVLGILLSYYQSLEAVLTEPQGVLKILVIILILIALLLIEIVKLHKRKSKLDINKVGVQNMNCYVEDKYLKRKYGEKHYYIELLIEFPLEYSQDRKNVTSTIEVPIQDWYNTPMETYINIPLVGKKYQSLLEYPIEVNSDIKFTKAVIRIILWYLIPLSIVTILKLIRLI